MLILLVFPRLPNTFMNLPLDESIKETKNKYNSERKNALRNLLEEHVAIGFLNVKTQG